MANFGRKMWAWKHSLKPASNTEMKPDVISLARSRILYNSGLIQTTTNPTTRTDAEFNLWNSGGGYDTENSKAFLFLKSDSRFSDNPIINSVQYATIDVADKLTFANADEDHEYDTYVSFDLQNNEVDPYTSATNDFYSTLLVSGVTPHNPLDIDYGTQENKLGNNSYYSALGQNGQQLAGFNQYYNLRMGEANIPRSVMYNNYKTVAGTQTLAATYELSQIKTSEPYNWNEDDGGSPEFDLWGDTTHSSYEKEYKTWTGNLPTNWLSSANDMNGNPANVKLDNMFAGKPVKFTEENIGSYANDIARPDHTAIVDIAFEIELALQRYGCDYSTHDFTGASSKDYSGLPADNIPDAVPQLSYVAGNLCFSKSTNSEMTGSYLFVPVYLKTITLGPRLSSGTPVTSTDVSISGKGHVYKYVIVAIRLEKKYNVGSYIPNSGYVIDLDKPDDTIPEAYQDCLGVGAGISSFDSVPDAQLHQTSFKHARIRKNFKALSGTTGYSGGVTPVTCFRVSEDGKYGFYSGGTIFDGQYNGPTAYELSDDVEVPVGLHIAGYPDNGVYRMYVGDGTSNTNATYKDCILQYDIPQNRGLDPSAATNLQVINIKTDLGIPNTGSIGEDNHVVGFVVGNDGYYSSGVGSTLWVLTGGLRIYEFEIPTQWDLTSITSSNLVASYDLWANDGISQPTSIWVSQRISQINGTRTEKVNLYVSCGNSDLAYANKIVQWDLANANTGTPLATATLSGISSATKASETMSTLTNGVITTPSVFKGMYEGFAFPAPPNDEVYQYFNSFFVGGDDGKVVKLKNFRKDGEVDTLFPVKQQDWADRPTNADAVGRYTGTVAINSTSIIVGDRTDNNNRGRIWIYDKDSSSYVASISQSGNNYMRFGWSVAANDDYIVVSSPYFYKWIPVGGVDTYTTVGQVDIYDASTYAKLRTIENPWTSATDSTDLANKSYFGYKVAISPDGNYLAISGGGSYLHMYNPANGVKRWTVTTPRGLPQGLGEEFASLDLDISNLYVGASGQANNESASRAYFFNNSNGSLKFTASSRTSSPSTTNYGMGGTVAVTNNYFCVGAPRAEVNGLREAGQVDVYRTSNNSFVRSYLSPWVFTETGRTYSNSDYGYYIVACSKKNIDKIMVASVHGIYEYNLGVNTQEPIGEEWIYWWGRSNTQSWNDEDQTLERRYKFQAFDDEKYVATYDASVSYYYNDTDVVLRRGGSIFVYDNSIMTFDSTDNFGSTTQSITNFAPRLSGNRFNYSDPLFYFMRDMNGNQGFSDKTIYVARPKNYAGFKIEADDQYMKNISVLESVVSANSGHIITRFVANQAEGSAYEGANYFWHKTNDNTSLSTESNYPSSENYTTFDPFKVGGLQGSSDIVSINLGSTTRFESTIGYDTEPYPNIKTGYELHSKENAFIRSFRFSNDGKWLYVLWVTATRVVNTPSASIEQWVERYGIIHPLGYACDDSSFAVKETSFSDGAVRFSGATDKYVIQGDSSGGYLNSATSINVTPDGKYLQVMQPYSRKAGIENNKPMIVEHYLGGNDLSVQLSTYGANNSGGYTSNDSRFNYRGLEARSTNPYIFYYRLWWESENGSNVSSATYRYNWPALPVQPGNTDNTQITYTGSPAIGENYLQGGGSTVWAVWDRTYTTGKNEWQPDRSNWVGSGASVYESDNRWIADSDYDIMPSDFSWNREGTILYMYGAFPEDNNYLNAGGFRRRGMPYVLTAPLYATNNYPGCGQEPGSGVRDHSNAYSRSDYNYTYLYTNRIAGFLKEKDLMYPDQNDTSSVTYHSCYFYPNDYGMNNNFPGRITIKAREVQDYSGNYCWEFDDLNVSDTAVINENSETTPVENLILKKSMVNIAAADNPPADLSGIITYYFNFAGQEISYPPSITDTAGNALGTSDGVFIVQSSASDFANGTGYIIVRVSKDADWINGGGNSNNSVLLHFASTRPSNGLDAKLYFTETDFLEMCSIPLSWESKHGISTDADYRNFSKPRQSFAINYPTVWDDVPIARRKENNWQTTSGGYPTYDNSAMTPAELDVAFRNSAYGLTNWSMAFCSSPGLQNQDFPMASVFAPHMNGKYLYMIVEDTSVDRQNDPNNIPDNFRPLTLAIIPIETNIEQSVVGDSPLYDYYWGQDTDFSASYPVYNYLNWGITKNSVDGPRMPRVAEAGSKSTSIYPNTRQWGGMYAVSDSRTLKLSYSSNISADSNTRLKAPELYQIPNAVKMGYYGTDRDSISSRSLKMLGATDKAFRSYLGAQRAFNYKDQNLTERGSQAGLGPIIEYSYGNVAHYTFKDIKGGKYGLYFGVGEGGATASVSFADYNAWGINNQTYLQDSANPFLNATFMTSNWGYASDLYDVPKIVYSKPAVQGYQGFSERLSYYHVLQRNASIGFNPLLTTYPRSKGTYYITNQEFYNGSMISQSAKAYYDYKEKYNSGNNSWVDIPTSFPENVNATSIVEAASGTGLGGETNVTYLNSDNSSDWGEQNQSSLRSFRFADNGTKFITLISGEVSSIGGVVTGNPGFTITKYDLSTPYDILSRDVTTAQHYTFHQDQSVSGAQYYAWWNGKNAPYAYFGADFAVHPDGDRFWIIGLESTRTANFGNYWSTESRVILREFSLSTDWDFSTASPNGFANYDTVATQGSMAPLEVPVSLEVSPDGLYVYWTQQFGDQTNEAFDPGGPWRPPGGDYNHGDPDEFRGSNINESEMRHLKVELATAYNLKAPVDSSDNKIVETISGPSGPMTRTTRGSIWTADEGAAQRIRFINEDRWYRTNYASSLVREDEHPSIFTPSDTQHSVYKSPVLNWPIGGISTFSNIGHKTQKVDGSFSIGNMGMFKNTAYSTNSAVDPYPVRREVAKYDMFIFEVNPEESVILVSDTQRRIIPLLFNNNTKAY